MTSNMTNQTVCVTGGSGFLGSYVVKLLLDKGYRVHTTVRDLNNAKKVARLRALPGADEGLVLFQADLLEDGSFDKAIEGCSGVFHTTSPVLLKTQTMSNNTVCVTGGSGFLGSHVVKQLLDKGYRVHTTVRNVNDDKKVAHLRALPGAAERLVLFEAELLEEGSFDKAIEGCSGVFHTASPFFTQNQTKESLVVPAVQGTLNVLRSCARHESVRRVVLTSSTASVYVHCGTKPADYVFTEVDWSNIEGMEKINMWYCVSKTIAEKTAYEFAEKQSTFDLVSMCPSLIFGPMLQPELNESSLVVYNILSGVTKVLPNSARAVVDVRDVAQAHIAGFQLTSNMTNQTVCVTGGSGFLGSYVVKLLLDKGYRVHTTVRDLNNAKKVAHLRALPGADERLVLFQADLLEDGSFDKAIEGCSGVFHTASPVLLKTQTYDSLVVPALQGTLNVLNSCARHPSVRRVIFTSSAAAVYIHCDTLEPSHVFTEADWSNKTQLQKNESWYCVSKILAEEAAHDFVKNHNVAFNLIAINPCFIFGPMLPPGLNESSEIVYDFFSATTFGNGVRNVVDVRDVAAAHIAAFETSSASGRYLLIAQSATEQEICEGIRQAAPFLANKLPIIRAEGNQAPRVLFDCSKAQNELGISFLPLQGTLDATVKSFMSNNTVCVTGGSGFLGSHVVKQLLDKGYRVHTTVRNANDDKKVAHLRALPGAAERLVLFEADLLGGSFDKAIEGCSGVFHTASPFFTQNQTKESLVVPSVQGTLNVLRSCARHESVRRVVLTSSTAAIYVHCNTLPDDHVFTEADWSNEERMEKLNLWYCMSKTLAERKANDFMTEKTRHFDLVIMCPTLIFGPMLQPVLNESSKYVHKFASGQVQTIGLGGRAIVDVRDVAQAHVNGFEIQQANGRYMLVSCFASEKEICEVIRTTLPSSQVPTEITPGSPSPRQLFDTSRAKNDLGIQFRSLDEMVRETCFSLQNHGFI
ncbi:hypothetical protein THRCLA_03982 [Thraustotheca clavata]|uniref:Ketoreductase domain-containing protein n=1 Tax=Thraustotheca clavata TaxID=74557 RepID=A0A1W0A082_9STRA|nr:hypothetical protein THRCLA_03982 [Thraustotheca clavata]